MRLIFLIMVATIASSCSWYKDMNRGDFGKPNDRGRQSSINNGSGATGLGQEVVTGDGTRPRGTSLVEPNPTFQTVPNQ